MDEQTRALGAALYDVARDVWAGHSGMGRFAGPHGWIELLVRRESVWRWGKSETGVQVSSVRRGHTSLTFTLTPPAS